MNYKKLLSNFITCLVLVNLVTSCAFNLPITRDPSSTHDSISLPSVEDDTDKLKILMSIHKQLPEIFSDAARFDINLFEILDDQEKLQKLLNEDPEYQKLWNSKKFTDFTFKVKSQDGKHVVENKQISEKTVTLWKEQIKNLLKANKNINLEKEIHSLLSSAGKLTSSGILNGLILNLPKNIQIEAREFQKKKEDDKLLSLLSINLPETLPNFKSEGIAPNPKSAELIKKYKDLFAIESKLGPLIDAYSFTHSRHQTIEQFFNTVDNLTRQDLENLNDVDYQKNTFDKLFKQENAKAPQAYSKYLKNYTNQTEIISSEIKASYQVTLKEQNPNIAIFRGCTGGDCSSQYSFPYPNDPNERVFFIYDEKGSLKGYVSATMVEIENNDKALYVITISGNRVNSVDTSVILQGLYKEREALGVKQIILPSQGVIPGLINFSPIRTVYEQATKGKPEIDLVHNNTEIRSKIETFSSSNNSGKYDHMANNASGVIYSPGSSDQVTLSVEKSSVPIDLKKLHIEEKFDSTALLEFIMAIQKSGRANIVEKIINSGFETEEKKHSVKKLLNVLENSNAVTREQLDEAIKGMTQQLNINPQRLEAKRVQWFLNYLLSTSDALEPKNLTKNLDYLLWDLRNNNPPIVFKSIFKAYKNKISTHKDYPKLMEFFSRKILENDVFFKEIADRETDEHMRISLFSPFIINLYESGDADKLALADLIIKRFSEVSYKHDFFPPLVSYAEALYASENSIKKEKGLKLILKIENADAHLLYIDMKSKNLFDFLIEKNIQEKNIEALKGSVAAIGNFPDIDMTTTVNKLAKAATTFNEPYIEERMAYLFKGIKKIDSVAIFKEFIINAKKTGNRNIIRTLTGHGFSEIEKTGQLNTIIEMLLEDALQNRERHVLENLVEYSQYFKEKNTNSVKYAREIINFLKGTEGVYLPTFLHYLFEAENKNDYSSLVDDAIELIFLKSKNPFEDLERLNPLIKRVPVDKKVSVTLSILKGMAKIPNGFIGRIAMLNFAKDSSDKNLKALSKIVTDNNKNPMNWEKFNQELATFEKTLSPRSSIEGCNQLVKEFL